MMKLRLATPSYLVDINKLTDLAYVRQDNDHLAVGALARHAEIAELENLADFSPVMADVAVDRRPAGSQPRNHVRLGGPL